VGVTFAGIHQRLRQRIGPHDLETVGTGDTIAHPRLKHRLHLRRDRASSIEIGSPPKRASTSGNGMLMMRPHSQTIRMSARCRAKSITVVKCAVLT
jgi:hypothetical protein